MSNRNKNEDKAIAVHKQIEDNVKRGKAARKTMFYDVSSTMRLVDKAERTLAAKLAKVRQRHAKMEAKEFYWTFVAYSIDEGYCYRWAQQMLNMADVRLRSKRKDEGTKREKKVKQYSAAEMEEFYSAMKKTEAAKFARFVARQS